MGWDRPTPRPLPEAHAPAVSAQLTRRRQLVQMLTAERQRLPRAPQRIRADIQAHVAWLERRLARSDADKAFYERLRAAGKAAKVALSASMRKLLTIVNAMIKHRTRWQEKTAQTA